MISAKCPIRTTLEMLGGKWRLLIIQVLSSEKQTFGRMKRSLPEISDKMLSQELKILQDNHLILRTETKADGISYELTEAGQQAIPLIHSMKVFAEAYHKSVQL